jgi:hypothetical protein
MLFINFPEDFMTNQELYEERARRIADAIALKEPSRVANAFRVSGLPYHLYGGSHKSALYNYQEATDAFIRYHQEFSPDAASAPQFMSGKANEIAESGMLDWPGKPGSIVPDLSTYQVIEQEYLLQEEYDELVKDYSGFIFNKYFPRAYPGLKGFEFLRINPSIILGTQPMAPMFNPALEEAMSKFIEIIKESRKAQEASAKISAQLNAMGFPPLWSGAGQVPFDILSDYFRGTMGMFFDLVQCPEKVAEACELFVDIQIAGWEYLKNPNLPIKRVFFPLHKGMDGFMSGEQYETLYWKPFQKLLKFLTGIGATPVIFAEGPYATRIKFMREQLLDLPRGSCIVYFEEGDIAQYKKEFAGIACLMGGLSVYDLEWSSREKVVNSVKYLIDNCAAGGGYLLSGGSSSENARRENIEALFETVETYGRK